MKKTIAVILVVAGGIYFINKLHVDTIKSFSSTETLPSKTKVEAVQKAISQSQKSETAPSATTGVVVADKMAAFLNCYANEKCDYPQTDPKSYGIALNKDVASFLKSSRVSDFINNEAMEKSLRELMKEGDGFVQEEVLKLLSQLPISEESLQAIIEGLKNNYADPLIMEQVMGELARYQGSGMADQVRGFMAETLLSGPQFSAEKAAQKIRPLLSAENIPYYRDLANRTRSSAVKTALQSSLNDYELSLGGG